MINICSRLALEALPSKTIKLGYDDEANKMIIVSAADGNLKLCKSGSMHAISCTSFLKALGIKRKFSGRYEAYVDEEMNIVIDLNKPLPEEEQAKRKNKEIDNGVTTLKDLREQAGLSVKEVAKILGVTINAIRNYELGWRKIGIEQVLRLVEAYDVPAEEVIRAQLNSCLRAQECNLH